MGNKIKWAAVDWGIAHLRLWLMASDNSVILHRDAACSGGQFSATDPEGRLIDLLADALTDAGPLPVICCGIAWPAVSLPQATGLAVPCPAPSAADAVRMHTRDPRLRVWLLPGLVQRKPVDIMQGEATQIAGFLAANAGFDGIVCLPGPHTTWAHVSADEIVSFRTFMTGELVSLLGEQSVLRQCVTEDGWDKPAFSEALSQSMSRPESVASALLSLRARHLMEGPAPNQARARLLGHLIGLELAAARPYWLGQEVAIIGDGELARAYAAGLALRAVRPRCIPDPDMTLQGLILARSALEATN